MKTIVKGFWKFGVTTSGTWHEVKGADGRTAQVSCPKCSKILSLDNHIISSDGVVQGKLICPKDSCPFEEYVTLDAWNA